jgi:hypothetical protein
MAARYTRSAMTVPSMETRDGGAAGEPASGAAWVGSVLGSGVVTVAGSEGVCICARKLFGARLDSMRAL